MILYNIFFVTFFLLDALSATLIAEEEIETYLKADKKIVAFYNVFAEGNDYASIVQGQLNIIKGSGLLDKLDNIYYATMGKDGKTFDFGGDKYIHIAHYGDRGSELQTLNMLHTFCHANPASKVMYFHNKGSFHHTYANAKFCSLLNCYVLNRNCLAVLDDHDTCGWRITPTPHPHYSGNFWWARCDYVIKLIDPMAPVNNQTFIDATKTLNECVGLDGRYFAETWIGTGPSIHPADCMNSTIDSSYVWGYRFPYAADAACSADPNVPSGLPCQTASTLTNVLEFKNAIQQMNGLIPVTHCRDNRQEIIKRSQMMYGEDPHTYIKWMETLYAPMKLDANALVRFTDSTQVYLNKDGVLRGVPNLKTFMTLGRDFDEVKTIYASERGGYSIGDMLPSV